MAEYQAGTAFVAISPSLRGFNTKLSAELKAIDPEVKVRVTPIVDRSAFRGIEQQTRGLSDKTVKVNVRAEGVSQSLIGIAALSRALGTLAVPGALLALTPALLSVASSAATASGAALLLPAALGAGALAAGTLAVGLGGLGDTLKALGAADEATAAQAVQSAGQRTSAAKAVASAQRSLQQAQTQANRAAITGDQQVRDARRARDDAILTGSRQVASAELDLRRAQQQARETQEDLTRARAEAREELQQLQFSVEGAGLAEEEAADRLEDARARLAEARARGAGGEEIQDLERDVRRADLSLREAADRYRDLQAEGQRWAQTGVEGSDRVVQAQGRVSDAAQGVRDAEVGLRQARIDQRRDVEDAETRLAQTVQQASWAQQDAAMAVADAQRQLADAITDTGETASATGTKAALALAALSPAAQGLIGTLRGLKPAWDALRLDVQETLLAGIGDRVQALAGIYLPILKTSMVGVASGFNAAFKETSRFLETPKATVDIALGMDNVTRGVNNASGAMRPLTQLFTDLFAVGSTFLPAIGQGFANAAQRAADFIARARESGQLRIWIQDALNVFGQLWQIIKNVGSIFVSVMGASDASGKSFLTTVEQLTGRIAAGLKTPAGAEGLREFFVTIRTVVGLFVDKLVQLWPAIAAAGGALGALLIAAGPLSSVLFGLVTMALVPMLNAIEFLAPVLGPALVLFGAWRAAVWLVNGAMVALRTVTALFTAVNVAYQLAMGTNLVLTNAQAAAQSRFTVVKYAGIVATNLIAAAQWLWNASILSSLGSMLLMTIRTVAFTAVMGAYYTVLGIVRIATLAWTAAQWLLNAALLANPIGIVIGILALLVGAFIYAWKNSETFRNIVMGVWNAIKTGLQATWAVIDFIFGLLKAGFTFVGNLILGVVKGTIQVAWDALVSGLRWVKDRFWDAVHWIGDMWGKLRGFLAKPINFMIDVVWNKGLLKAWNAVAGLLPGINPIAPLPLIPEFARGGAVHGPGTETSDSIPARLSRDEHVWTAREVRGAGGHEQIEGLREAARRGTLRYYAAGGPVGFAGGGAVYQQLFSLVRGAFPNANLNSGYRPGDPGFHGRSKAVDLGTQGRSGGLGHPGLAGMNRWIHDTYGKGSAELIYDGLGDDRPDIYRGRPHTYNPGTRADHRNHVHWAVNDMRDLGGGGLFGAIGGAIGGVVSYFRDKVAEIFRDVTDPIRGMIDRTMGQPPPAFRAVPGGMFTKFRDAALSFLTAKADERDMASGDVGLGGYAKGAPFYIKEIARAGRAAGVGRAGNIIGMATALVESNLKMYANRRVPASFNFPHDAVGADHDSVGLFQQRQAGWGTLAQRMNPFGSAMLFYNALNRFNWRAMAPGAAAQRVQRSAFPGRYAGRVGEAGRLLDIHAGGGYDRGGFMPPGFGTYYNGTRKPEAVLTDQQWRDIRSGTTGGDAPVQNFYVQETTNPESTAEKIARRQAFGSRLR